MEDIRIGRFTDRGKSVVSQNTSRVAGRCKLIDVYKRQAMLRVLLNVTVFEITLLDMSERCHSDSHRLILIA